MPLSPTVFLMESDLVLLLVALEEPVRAIDARNTTQKRAGKVGQGMEPEPIDNDTCPPREEEKEDDEPKIHLASTLS